MLKNRSHLNEEMDNLNLEGETLFRTLDGLSFINSFLGNKWATLHVFKQELSRNPTDVVRVVDLGCGSGDNLRAIANWCSKKGQAVELCGIDGNQNILSYAKKKNGKSIHIKYNQADILDSNFELNPCDVLISSHFIYHFSDDELVNFIKKAKSKVNKAIIFSELQRSSFSFLLFKIFGKFMPFSKMVKQDGLLAIQRSFKRGELEQIVKRAGMKSYTLHWKWAFRYLLLIRLD